MAKERLDKIIASTGRYSRKEVRELVRKGRVLVNGNRALKSEEKADALSDQISVDGELISASKFTYLMLHKPEGVVTATKDDRDRTVMDLLPDMYRRRNLSPVGRLDKDTEGLLLITDDGDMAHRLLAPKKHVDKTYFVRVAGVLDPSDAEGFANGMELGDGTLCQPAELEILSADSAGEEARDSEGNALPAGRSEALVTIREGKYHQVKRMFAARGKKVIYLKRIRMGPLTLDPDLPKGEFRLLTEEEVLALRQAVYPEE